MQFMIALYPFETANRYEVSLAVGDKIQIEEEIKGWYKGTVVQSQRNPDNVQKKGTFPGKDIPFLQHNDKL
jgi:hypothetical protein